MRSRHLPTLAACIALALSCPVSADWGDTLNSAAGVAAGIPGANDAGGKSGIASGLSAGDLNGGLKDALGVGAERAIEGLGRPGGFLNDKVVRIPLPGPLQKLEKTLRMLGQGKRVDEFEETLNRAAEQAVPKAAPIVGKAVREMSINDARGILTGPDDAATRYFRTKTSGTLATTFLPVVKSATDRVGATHALKKLLDHGGIGASLGDKLDLDKYVTDKILDGLFLKLADEEKSIRKNPAARSTDLLKKVFSSK